MEDNVKLGLVGLGALAIGHQIGRQAGRANCGAGHRASAPEHSREFALATVEQFPGWTFKLTNPAGGGGNSWRYVYFTHPNLNGVNFRVWGEFISYDHGDPFEPAWEGAPWVLDKRKAGAKTRYFMLGRYATAQDAIQKAIRF